VIARFVELCLGRRWLVLGAFGLMALFGAYAWTQLSIEAYPDIADTSAQVITQYLGHAAEEVEEQVTVPLERALNGIPGLHVMRSRSTFGLSLITLVFRDGVEDYWARQRVRERIEGVSLPPGAEATLDPLTSPVGEIYRYTLESSMRGQRELRELQQWVVIPALRQVFGVADVSNFGGESTQFQVVVDPARLFEYNLSLHQVVDAIKMNNANAGGSLVVRGDQQFVVRGLGLIRSIEDLGNIVVAQKAGTPVLVRDLGRVELGAPQRRGILGKDDNSDGVSGIVLLLRGMNPSQVLDGIHAKVDELNQEILPKDVKVVPYLDRTTLVDTTLHTVARTLIEGVALVFVVLLAFLGSLRGAVIVATTIPLSLLMAFILMHLTGVPANLLSLGAIDFGIIVNGAIVVLENVLARREARPGQPLGEGDVRLAATQVARPMFFAMAIIITAYLPLFAFQRVEKKLFTPMAYTIGYALCAATLVALALIPGLARTAFVAPGRRVFHNRPLEWLTERYQGLLRRLIARPRLALVPGALALALALLLSVTIGRTFLPDLDEGSLWLQVTFPPGISLPKASQMADEVRRVVREFPQVSCIVTQVGRVDDDLDPWTPSHMEAAVCLRPYETWPRGMTKRDLVARMRERLGELAGVAVGFSQPMIDMVNDKISGAHSELVVKIFGADLDELRRVASDIQRVLGTIEGAADIAIDQEPPLPQLHVKVNREAAARFGINVADVAELIEVAVGGRAVDTLIRGERRYPIAVRFMEEMRRDPNCIANLTLSTSSKARIPLSQVAEIALRSGESTITRENNRRHLTVKLAFRGSNLAAFLREAQSKIERGVGYDHARIHLAWGGEFENQNRAQARLAVIVPVALGLILLLLYGAFGAVRHALLVLANVPLALLGGMLALHLRGMTLNVSSAVGFIALFGVAVQNGLILVEHLNQLVRSGMSLSEAIIRGARSRLRPVLMTGAVASLGLLPAALARGIGSDVQRPLATVVVGGLVTATLLPIFVLPVLYWLVESRRMRRRAAAGIEALVPAPKERSS
jgi:cobalt-zinc-cadmium resistance protein CzcA